MPRARRAPLGLRVGSWVLSQLLEAVQAGGFILRQPVVRGEKFVRPAKVVAGLRTLALGEEAFAEFFVDEAVPIVRGGELGEQCALGAKRVVDPAGETPEFGDAPSGD